MSAPVLGPNTPRYRNSQLQMRRVCDFAYAKSYIELDPGIPSPSLRAGQNVHAAVKEAVHAIVEGGLLNVHDIAYRTVRGGNVEYKDAVDVLTSFQEMLGDSITIDPAGVFMLEETLEIPLQLPDGTWVIYYGTPDLGTRTGKRAARIDDWKTHFWPESFEAFLADPQLPRYWLLVAHNYPALEQAELVKYFLRYRGNSHRVTLTRAHLEQIKLDLISEIVVTRERELQGAPYEPTGGAWCGVCAHTASCPIVRRYREQGIDDVSIADDTRARELAGDMLALDAFVTQMQNSLKRYLGAEHITGNVSVAGGEYGYAPTEGSEIEASMLRDVLIAAGLELPMSVFNVNKDELERLKKKLPGNVAKAIEKITVRRQGARCTFRRWSAKTTTPAASAVADGELL